MAARRALQRKFGVSAATLRYLERSGFVKPWARLAQHDFRDLVVLRAVGALKAAKLSTRTIHRALTQLRPWLTAEQPLSRVSLQRSHNAIVVRDGHYSWEPQTGQYSLPLEVATHESQLIPMKKRSPPSKTIDTAHDHYLRGADLEAADADAAKAAYRACLEGDCSHMNARINLGRLLHLEGKHREAESIYRDTQEPHALLFFNLGVLLEDRGKPIKAMAAYRDALIHDPGMADAHFNLALLHERAGETQAAFRHLLAYRRITHSDVAARR